MEEARRTSLHGERRRYPRFELSQALAYQWGVTKGTLRTVDLSLGGIKIQTDSPIPVDERWDLILLLKYEVIKPVGKTVRSNPSSYRKYDVGICFDTISHQCLKRLERFLNGTTLREELAKREKALDQSGLRVLESKSFELDRLRANFLRWLHRSYPWDYGRYFP
jgi:c-di-GMP-binding flagellar brake protein YcgR